MTMLIMTIMMMMSMIMVMLIMTMRMAIGDMPAMPIISDCMLILLPWLSRVVFYGY
jgi:hypothetical protein